MDRMERNVVHGEYDDVAGVRVLAVTPEREVAPVEFISMSIAYMRKIQP
jgi:hypothetical protein